MNGNHSSVLSDVLSLKVPFPFKRSGNALVLRGTWCDSLQVMVRQGEACRAGTVKPQSLEIYQDQKRKETPRRCVVPVDMVFNSVPSSFCFIPLKCNEREVDASTNGAASYPPPSHASCVQISAIINNG